MSWLLGLLEICGLNIVLALSVYATLKVGQFSLAQVGFWSIGGYLTGMLTTLYGRPLVPALLVSAAFTGVLGIVLGYPCLRIRGIYLTLATVEFTEVVRVLFHNFEYTLLRAGMSVGPAGPQGFRGIAVLTAWPQILVTVILAVALFAWFERTRLGLAAEAVREDETAASCAGVNVVAMKVGLFALGAALAGIGGGLYGTYTSFVNGDSFGFHLALISIFYVAVGGTGRFYGPVVGAVLLTILPEALRFAGDFRMVLYGVVILVVMLAFPRGLSEALPGLIRRFEHRRPAHPGPGVQADPAGRARS